MRGLKAALWKDLRLFGNGVGWVTILLPLVVLLAFRVSGGDIMRGAYLEPFPIAVRDEDGTIMSRTLLKQVSKVELFSQVIQAEDETDEQLLEQGCVGVVTVPEDFFYTTYTMEENPVRIVLNGDMPLESSVLRTMFTSVIGIIGADQAANRAVFTLCYGDLTQEQEQELLRTAANQVVLDALGRQGGFDSVAEAGALQDNLELGLLASVLSILCLFFALSVVKTLPEELHSGVLPRFLVINGRWGAFVGAKLITGMLVSLPALILLLLGFRVERWPLLFLLSELLFLSAFGLLAGFAVWIGEVDRVQRWGNLFVIVSLVLGGGIYGMERLPPVVQLVGRLSLPYYVRLGVREITRGATLAEVWAAVWPALGLGVLGWLAVWGGFRRRARPEQGGRVGRRQATAADRQYPSTRGVSKRLLAVGLLRGRVMSGGWVGLLCLLVCTALCGIAADGALNASPRTLRVAAAVEDGSPLADELVERIGRQPGVTVKRVTLTEGRRLVDMGQAEGLLVLDREYDLLLEQGERPPMTYVSASTSASARACREIIAGQSAAQRAEELAMLDAAHRLERDLTEKECTALRARIEEESREAPALYTLAETEDGERVQADPLAPNQLGFSMLLVMLTLFTWAAWTARRDARRVEERMLVFPGGWMLSYGGDIFALVGIGLAVGLCALLPGGIPQWETLGALFCYIVCIAGLGLALARHGTRSGRVDVLAPFVALITSLLGGCFGNMGLLSRQLQVLSLLTPQGLALRAQRGAWWAFVALLAAGGLFLWLGFPRPRRRFMGLKVFRKGNLSS